MLDYTTALEEALVAQGVRSAGIRRMAMREARRLIDAMAFRFALMDERPLPEDLDYVRAIEAMKAPAQAAAVLARKAPQYASARRRRLALSWGVLALVVLLVGGLAWIATSEKGEIVAHITQNAAVDVQYSNNTTFTVDPGVVRLHLDGSVFVTTGSSGDIEVRLYRTNETTGDVETAYVGDFYPRGDNYPRFDLEYPKPGTWTLLVDFDQAHGSADVSVQAIRPAR